MLRIEDLEGGIQDTPEQPILSSHNCENEFFENFTFPKQAEFMGFDGNEECSDEY